MRRLLHAHLHRQRPARLHLQSRDRSVTPAARAAARVLRRPPASAPSPMATTSAVRYASPPTATAWSGCARASRAFPRSIPARRRAARSAPSTAVRAPHSLGARCPAGAGSHGAGDRRDWRWNDVPMQGPPPPVHQVAIVPRCRAPDPSRERRRATRRQASADGRLCRRGDVAAGHGARRRAVASDHVSPTCSVAVAAVKKMGDPDAIAAMEAWLQLHKTVDLPTYVAAQTQREGLMLRSITFFQRGRWSSCRRFAICRPSSAVTSPSRGRETSCNQ